MSPELEKILSEIRGESNTLKPVSTTPKLASFTAKPVKFDVPVEAIYDRLGDGTYVPKFENYQGSTGNEERLAQQQGFLEKAGRGLAKFAIKTGTNAIDATIGTAYGIVNGISEGKFSAVWDNDFSNHLDDLNKRVNNNLAHYYTQEEKNKSILGQLGTANFWFDKVGDGMAFVAGAILPEMAIGVATGGASLGVGLGKLGSRAAIKTGKELAEAGVKKGLISKIDDAVGFTRGRSTMKEWNRAIYGKKAGDAISTAGFLVRTSNFEAGIEARHNYHQAMDSYLKDFEDLNGRQPTLKEIGDFSNTAKNVANGVYATNMAILGISNTAMYGKMFGVKIPTIANTTLGKKITNQANRLIGLGTKTLEDGKIVMRGANKAQKVLGNTYKFLSKPATEGLFEEGLQGVTGKMMQSYLEDKYNPNNTESYSFASDLGQAMKEQYGTKEGWEEIGIGMVIGFIGGALPQGPGAPKTSLKDKFPGFGKNGWKATYTNMEADLEQANQGLAVIRGLDRASSIQNYMNQMNSGSKSFTSASALNTKANLAFIQSQEHLKTAKEMKQDFDAVVDNMELDENQMQDLQDQGIDLDLYKDSLKTEFRQTIEDYSYAKKAVEAVGLDREIKSGLKETRGNIDNIKEAMVANIMLGRNALRNAEAIATQIDQVIAPTTFNDEGMQISTGGIFNSLQHYNNLDQSKKQEVERLRDLQSQLKELEQISIGTQQELAKIQTQRQGDKQNIELENEYNKVAEKSVLTTNKITEVTTELDKIKSALNSSFNADNYDLSGTLAAQPQSIEKTLEELDKIDNYIQSLRIAGKDYEAGSLEYLVEEFKTQSDFHREMINGHRRMLETNFFQSDSGARFIDKIVGKRYKMSDDFKKELKEKDAIVDQSLGLVGIRGYETVEALVEEVLEKNPNLSEREKFRLESILRLQLNLNAQKERLDVLTGIEYKNTTEAVQEPLEGDTIRLKQELDLKAQNLDNLDVLNKAITDILTQIDYIRNKSVQTDTTTLENELADLKKQKEDLIKQTQPPITSAKAVTTSVASGIDRIKIPRYFTFGELGGKPGKKPGETIESEKNSEIKEDFEKQLKEGDKLVEPNGDVFFYRNGVIVKPNGQPRNFSDVGAFLNGVIIERITKTASTATSQISNGDKITDVPFKKVTNEITDTNGELFISEDKNPEGRVFINMDPLKDILVIPNNTFTIIDKNSGKKIISRELNPEGAVIFEAMQGRLFVVANINGQLIPFYKSSAGTSGKTQGEWYPFFGYTGAWLVKGSVDKATGKMNYSPEIDKVTTLLNDNLVFPDKYINRVTNTVKNTDGDTMFDFNRFFKVNRLWKKADDITVGKGVQYNVEGLKENTRSESAAVALITGLNTTELDSSNTPKELREWFNLIDKKITLQQTYQPTQTTTPTPVDTTDIDNKIKEVEDKIAMQREGIKIMDTPEYKRMIDLMVKREARTITDEETKELEKLEKDTNEWLLITGTVVEGYRLSDLIRQKVVLESTKVNKPEAVTNVTASDLVDNVEFTDKPTRANYSFGQSYGAVTAVRDGDYIVVSGIKYEALKEITGDFQHEVEEGTDNILIKQDEVDRLNQEGKISIVPTNTDLATNYSVVYKHETNMAGEVSSIPLNSPFRDDFEESQNIDVLYNTEAGAPIYLEIDPKDPYNKELIAKVKSATTTEELEEATEELRRGAVIRARVESGAPGSLTTEFVSVFKANRRGETKSEADLKFETYRRGIVDNAIANKLLVRSDKITVITDPVTVDKIWLGHPNFMMTKNADGTVSIKSKQITQADLSKIDDIGYLYGNKLQTKANIKGIDTTFLEEFRERSKTSKIPFVVIKKGKYRIAYPVQLIPKPKESNQVLIDIFNNDKISDVEKATKLNKILASRGIDIKDPGSAFIAFGKTNLTQDFLDNKLAQLDNIEYFRPMEDWLKPTSDMNRILEEQVLINIDLTNPFHSPKLQFNFEEPFKNLKVAGTPSAKGKRKSTKKNTKTSEQKVQEALNKRCQPTKK